MTRTFRPPLNMRLVALYVFLPSGMNLINLTILLSMGDAVLHHMWAAWVISLFSFFASISTLTGYFHNEVPNRFALLSMLMNGIVTILVFAAAYRIGGIIYDGPFVDHAGGQRFIVGDFGMAIYFSITTFTTLGYGDFQPADAVRGLAAVEALMGYVYLGLIIGVTMHWAAQRSSR